MSTGPTRTREGLEVETQKLRIEALERENAELAEIAGDAIRLADALHDAAVRAELRADEHCTGPLCARLAKLASAANPDALPETFKKRRDLDGD